MINALYGQEGWIDTVRTTAYPLGRLPVDSIIKNANETYISGIEVDNDIPGRYLSFLNPAEKLQQIKDVAEKAHEAGNHSFVYVAGLECITPDAAHRKHTLFKDHPDWVQRDINGRPAKFSGDDAFWIHKGDEDVWVSPYAPEWRKTYMERIRQIASTGIDGIYVDIPYWMTHFTGWEKTWASFDKYTVAEFKKETGLNAKTDIKIGDFDDPGFVQWVKFRIKTITDFLEEIKENIESVNPECKLIPEIYPGLGEDAVRVGADVYQIYKVADVITHEYDDDDYYAAIRKPFNWLNYLTGIRTFRAFAEDKPTWILSYSWHDNKNVNPSEAMKNLFVSEIFSGANVWDAKGFVMSSSNDMNTRTEVYKWIASNKNQFYGKSKSIGDVGVYFSVNTRDMFPDEYLESYRGMIALLMNNHITFKIVTPRTLSEFDGKVLIMDNAKCVDSDEIRTIEKLKNSGVKFLVSKDAFEYDENRVLRMRNVLKTVLGIAEGDTSKLNDKNALLIGKSPGKEYYDIIKSNMNNYFENDTEARNKIEKYCKDFISKLSKFSDYNSEINIQAPLQIVSSVYEHDSHKFITLINIKGLCAVCAGKEEEQEITISYPKTFGSGEVSVTPFLNESHNITPKEKGNRYFFTLTKVEKGTVVRID